MTVSQVKEVTVPTCVAAGIEALASQPLHSSPTSTWLERLSSFHLPVSHIEAMKEPVFLSSFEQVLLCFKGYNGKICIFYHNLKIAGMAGQSFTW